MGIAPRRFQLSFRSASPLGAQLDASQRFVGEANDGPLPIPDGPDGGEVNSIITVPVDTEIQSLAVRVEIRHPARGNLLVQLFSPGRVLAVLHQGEGGITGDLFRTYTSADDQELEDLVGGGTIGMWELIVEDRIRILTGTLERWGLEINAHVQLGTGARVPAVVTLSGVETLYGESRLFPSETLLVGLRYEDLDVDTEEDGVTMSPPTLEFRSPIPSLALTNLMVLEVVSPIPTSGLLELTELPDGGLTNAVVGSTSVLVQIVRQFRLAFATPEGAPLEQARVMAGATTEVRVVLDSPETLEEGEVVRVSFATTRVTVIPSQPTLTLTPDEASKTILISAPADTDMPRGEVVASGELLLRDGTTADIEVVAGSLAVEVILHTFRLEFDPASVSVVAGATTQVKLTLMGDDMIVGNDPLVVMFSDVPGVEVVEPVMLRFTAGSSTEAMVTLEAATTATDGRLRASVAKIVGTDVVPATLDVEILPRSYSLAFDVAAVSVVAGGTTEVMVVLTGDTELIGDDEFTVMFSYEPQDGGVSAEAAMLNAAVTSATVSLIATAIAQDGTLTATVSGVDGATFAPATLSMEIIPRSYSLAFDVAAVSVVAGGTTEVMVVLTGDTEPIGDDEFTVIFSYEPPDGGVSAEAAMLNAEVTSATVSLVATAIAQDGTLTASVSGVDGATVAPATLSMEIIPRSYSLTFNVETVSVVAGGTTEVMVVLTGDTELIGEDEFTVIFSYEPPDGGVSAEAAMLNAEVTSATVSLVATAIAQDGTLTASVSGVDGATFAPATLSVEITPRLFSLAFDATTVSVVAGGTTEVMVVLTGDTELMRRLRRYVASDPDAWRLWSRWSSLRVRTASGDGADASVRPEGGCDAVGERGSRSRDARARP